MNSMIRTGVAGLAAAVAVLAADALPPVAGNVTFSKDIAPILQRSCQNCHQPESVAPMSLMTALASNWRLMGMISSAR